MLLTKISKDNKKKKTTKDANVHLPPSSISKLGGLLRHSSEKKVRNTDCSIIGVFYFKGPLCFLAAGESIVPKNNCIGSRFGTVFSQVRFCIT